MPAEPTPLYGQPPAGWTPAERTPGRIAHWDGPSIVEPGIGIVTTFTPDDGITVESLDGTMLTPEDLRRYAYRFKEADEAVKRAEEEIS